MASRLTIAQTRLQEATAALTALEAQTAAMTTAESTATQEQVDAHIEAVRSARTAVQTAQREVVSAQTLLDMEQSRSTNQTQAPGQGSSTTSYPGPGSPSQFSVTPRAEQDPRRGYRVIGQLALDVKTMQDAQRRGMPLDTRTAERLAVVLNDTAQFTAMEQADQARYGAAAPSPLHQEGHSTDGIMVPVDFRNEIWKPAYEADDLLPLFAPQPTSSRVVQFAADETTPWGASGIKAYWTAEGAQKTPSKLALSPREVHLHKIAALVYTTDELLQDTTLLTARINEAAPRAIGWEVSEALVRGNGVGKPLGFELSPALVTIAKETNQKAGTIYTENVLNMASRINEGPGSRLLWLAHRSVIPSLATLKIGNEPSWTNQNQGLREAPNGMLLGIPIKFTQHARFRGTVGDIMLVDLAGYAAFVHSSGTRFDSSIHLYFDYDITAFRWVFRVGGMPYLSAPLAQANGSETISHFIELATRA